VKRWCVFRDEKYATFWSFIFTPSQNGTAGEMPTLQAEGSISRRIAVKNLVPPNLPFLRS
jgi:hypothetical protein